MLLVDEIYQLILHWIVFQKHLASNDFLDQGDAFVAETIEVQIVCAAFFLLCVGEYKCILKCLFFLFGFLKNSIVLTGILPEYSWC